tara:strand:- start:79 stop:576 length:498 start_codon:yes stop_codon:yes gene_type:complete
MNELHFHDYFGPVKFMPWSKSNEIWTTFYRTKVAGHWKREDAVEFMKADRKFEIHLDHADSDNAHSLCLEAMRRVDDFKAAKVSKIAINDMKVALILAKGSKWKDRVSQMASDMNMQLVRVVDRNHSTSYETHTNQKIREYLDALGKAFAPMASTNGAVRFNRKT